MLKMNEVPQMILDQINDHEREIKMKRVFCWIPSTKKLGKDIEDEFIYLSELKRAITETFIVIYQSPMFFSQRKVAETVQINEEKLFAQIKEVKEILRVSLQSEHLGMKIKERLINCLRVISVKELAYRQLFLRDRRSQIPPQPQEEPTHEMIEKRKDYTEIRDYTEIDLSEPPSLRKLSF